MTASDMKSPYVNQDPLNEDPDQKSLTVVKSNPHSFQADLSQQLSSVKKDRQEARQEVESESSFKIVSDPNFLLKINQNIKDNDQNMNKNEEGKGMDNGE